MSQQGQGQGDAGDEGLRILIASAMVLAVVAYLFMRHIDLFNAIIGSIAWLHILPFALIVSYFPAILDLPMVGPWLFLACAQAHDFLVAGGFAEMSMANVSALLAASGRAATVIYGPPLLWIIARGRTTRVDMLYRKGHSLEGMITVQSETWLTTRIARNVNPLKLPEFDILKLAGQVKKRVARMDKAVGAVPGLAISLRPASWNRSLRPQEWLVSGGLAYDAQRHDDLLEISDVAEPKAFEFRHRWTGLTIQGLSELLAEQLREPWEGPTKLPPHQKALYAVFALFYNYDVKTGNRLLEDLGALAGVANGKGGQMDVLIQGESELFDQIEKVCNGKAGSNLGKIASQHAWVESAFPRLLREARAGRGVLPSPAFLWLKGEDRTMWYILNGVGTDANMVECAGAMAHSKAEIQIGKPLRRPAMYQAARSLIEDYFDMTEERIRHRHAREIERRLPGEQIDRMGPGSEEAGWS